jgi:hypothetical protein
MSKKRGQVTILIIVGLIFLFVVALFFFIANKDEFLDEPPSKTPQLFIDQCIAQAVQPSITTVLDHGGFIIPEHFIRRNDHPYNYLCFVDLYYAKCYNYYPSLHLITQEQIRVDSRDRVEDCFTFLIEDYESQNYDVESGPLEYDVEVIPGSVRLRVHKEITTRRGDGSLDTFEDFDTSIPSDLYDLIGISRQIVNQEAEFCYFENNGFMMLYPNYNITKISYLESKLYEVQNRRTKETLKFAVRSCPFAPGIWAGGIDPDLIGSFSGVDDVRQFRDENNENET